MKFNTFIFILLIILITSNTNAQTNTYRTSSGEMIFSFSDVKEYNNTTEKWDKVPAGMRYTIFFHIQQSLHVDFNNTFGFFTGLGIRNIGITPAPDSIYSHSDKTYYKRASAGASVYELTTVKQRVYTLGLPLALKIGNFKKGFYFFAGGEYEYSFHYKEKIWIDGKKQKSSSWFTDETTVLLPSVFGGVKFPGGTMLKFKWYLQNFLNKNHTADLVNPDKSVTSIKPYEYSNAQLFYVSIAFIIEHKKPKEKPEVEGTPTPSSPKIDM